MPLQINTDAEDQVDDATEPEEEELPPPPVMASAPAVEGDREVLFTLDGVDYTIPTKPGPNVALGYLRDLRRGGEEYARAGLLERFVGRAAMDALADYDDLTDDDLTAVWKIVERKVLGPLSADAKAKNAAAGKGPGRATPRRR